MLSSKWPRASHLDLFLDAFPLLFSFFSMSMAFVCVAYFAALSCPGAGVHVLDESYPGRAMGNEVRWHHARH